MAIFSTNSVAADTPSAAFVAEDLGIKFSLITDAAVKELLLKVAGDIPAGKSNDSDRPRYSLLLGKTAMYAGFYLDNGSLKCDNSTNNGSNPDLIAQATYEITNAGNKNDN